MNARCIKLRGVEVHNLRSIDIDLPHGQLIVVCGVSGSGKTSLALDTLYAEGQRRYIESFSAYTRQFLERLEKPDAEQIEGIPPAIAVTAKVGSRSSRATVGTVTEINDYLRLLWAKIGEVRCPKCHRAIGRDSPQNVAERVSQLPEGTRLLLAYASAPQPDERAADWLARLRQQGALRAVIGSRLVNLADVPEETSQAAAPIYVVIDRLMVAAASFKRLRGSLEMAMAQGGGIWYVFSRMPAPVPQAAGEPQVEPMPYAGSGQVCSIDDAEWSRWSFCTRRVCIDCDLELPEPDPRLLSFNTPMGACPRCEGFGNLMDIDMDLVVPDPTKTLREGAIAPWNSPAYAHELQELLALADDYEIPVDIPFANLSDEHRQLIAGGVPARNFGGLRGFFAWLERRKYKMHLRVFLSRWRSYRRCPACLGSRLRPEALTVHLGDKNIAQISGMSIADALVFFQHLPLIGWQRSLARVMLDQIQSRLAYLKEVGLAYLTLDRPLRTLSRGELQRVNLTSALGSSLAGLLYVLDEPSVGLHPHDVDRLIHALRRLRSRGNTVTVVEHDPSIIRSADHLVELGPGAGIRGGNVIFQGVIDEMERAPQSVTGDWIAGRRGASDVPQRRLTDRGWIRLIGARGNNLKNITVEFPLGVLCLVTGVSGSGKSTLVQETLVPALARRLRKQVAKPLDHDDVLGTGQIDDVVMIDQGPIGKSPRSNPVTYIKAFDEIRSVFADTMQARMHNFSPGHFSFNVDGGRCESCHGDGQIAIDMQFLPDVYLKCDQCRGRRYRREILDVTYRGRNIAEVLELTVREAFTFFRGCPKVQARLKSLIDAGLDYLQLGQPASTLSGGEAQRLKLAGCLSAARSGHVLFVLDEPTAGLHFADIVHLLDSFESLLDVGHSLIVIEHNVQVMNAADYLIDLGPGAADNGGQIVAQGTPEQIAEHQQSVTGQVLAESRGLRAESRDQRTENRGQRA